jgi:hypothetical protein
MPAKVGYLVIDSTDPHRLAPFWCDLLEVTVDATIGDGEFLVLSPTEDGLTVGFQRVPEAKVGKNRLHLDLVVDDLDEERRKSRLSGVGGLSLATLGSLKDSPGDAWRTQKETNSTPMFSPVSRRGEHVYFPTPSSTPGRIVRVTSSARSRQSPVRTPQAELPDGPIPFGRRRLWLPPRVLRWPKAPVRWPDSTPSPTPQRSGLWCSSPDSQGSALLVQIHP